ncbi:MAG: hypothetical protein ACYDDA_10185 [Acidiferrobacteraceae bacterium]
MINARHHPLAIARIACLVLVAWFTSVVACQAHTLVVPGASTYLSVHDDHCVAASRAVRPQVPLVRAVTEHAVFVAAPILSCRPGIPVFSDTYAAHPNPVFDAYPPYQANAPPHLV